MTHEFEFQLTEPDYIAANRLNHWKWIRSRKAVRFIAIVGLIYAVLGAVIVFSDGGGISLANMGKIVAIALSGSAAIFIICLSLGYVLIPLRTRKLLAQQKLHHLSINYRVSDGALSWKNELTDTRLPYNMVYKWTENERLFLVYHSDLTFNIIAKNVAGKQAIDCLRDQLQKAGIVGRSL